jgi:hypothetical protein
MPALRREGQQYAGIGGRARGAEVWHGVAMRNCWHCLSDGGGMSVLIVGAHPWERDGRTPKGAPGRALPCVVQPRGECPGEHSMGGEDLAGVRTRSSPPHRPALHCLFIPCDSLKCIFVILAMSIIHNGKAPLLAPMPAVGFLKSLQKKSPSQVIKLTCNHNINISINRI